MSNTINEARVADMEELVYPTSGDVVSVAREEVYASQPSMQATWTAMVIAKLTDKLDDSAIDLGILTCGTDSDQRNAVSLTIERLFRRFLQLQTGTSDASVTGTLQKEFDAFLAYVIFRRRLRIQKWAKSKIGDQDSSEWKSVEKQQFIPLQSTGRCLGRCAHCYLGCMKAFGHVADGHGHDCGTTHLCPSVCAYCAEENCFNVCAKKAGHEDRCECDAEDHTCGAPCSLRGAPNCGGGYAEKSGHDSDHRCSVGKHRCGQPCFVNNCEGRCVLDVELPHAEHRCESDRCVQLCGFEGCDRLCCSSDHLHGQGYHESAMSVSQAISESVVAHLCGEEHECAELCDEDGICDLRVSQKHVLKTFAGARDTFRFTLQEMEGVRKKCTKSLPTGERLHLGSHSCAHKDEDKVHFCESRCPCCAYHCTKHQSHQGKHRTTHGNMRETLFVSDNRQIDFLDRKYQAGERGVAEMCNLFCSGAGRGNVHFLECEHRNALICQLTSGSKRRHCVKMLEPPPSLAMDELLHEAFWETLGWEDPCSSISERDSFKKCAYKCDSTEHDRDHASYCILPARHMSELTPEANERDGFSYVDGHKFECQHAASGKRMHHVFVLDCSGSMRGQPWVKLMEAFHEYVNNRISAGALQDVISVLTFSRTVEIVYEARDIMRMRDANVPFRGGETWYSEGLRGAHEVLSRLDSAKFTPVLVIFSDGRPHDPKRVDELGRRISHSYERVGLQAFMVGAGRANLSYLQRLAQLMGGRYLHALHNTELKNQFQKISASVGAKMSLAVASRW